MDTSGQKGLKGSTKNIQWVFQYDDNLESIDAILVLVLENSWCIVSAFKNSI